MAAAEGEVRWYHRLGLTVGLLSLSFTLLVLQAVTAYLKRTRKGNAKRRKTLLKDLGLSAEDGQRRYVFLGFFHPYCNAGGGGERVLFEAVRHHLEQDPDAVCAVYTGDVAASESLLPARGKAVIEGSSSVADGGGTATKSEILQKVKERFDIDLQSHSSRVAFLPLRSRRLISEGYWKRLTMLGQAFGSAVLAKEACEELIPDVFLDTMGWAFAFPVVRMFKLDLPIGAYVHYPMISSDMLERVRSRKAGHTNNAAVARSFLKSQLKIVYYEAFTSIYAWCLRRTNVVVANGSWTQAHVNYFLLGPSFALPPSQLSPSQRERRAHIVYPPCDTRSLEGFSLQDRDAGLMVSLAQFRPEKEHSTQLKFLRALLDLRPDFAHGERAIRLVMMGSCRNVGDEERIRGLRELASQLQLEVSLHCASGTKPSVSLPVTTTADTRGSTCLASTDTQIRTESNS